MSVFVSESKFLHTLSLFQIHFSPLCNHKLETKQSVSTFEHLPGVQLVLCHSGESSSDLYQINTTNRQPNFGWHKYRVNHYEVTALCSGKRSSGPLRIRTEICLNYATQPSPKKEKCHMFRLNPSLSKETTVAEQFLNDVSENSWRFHVILKSHTHKKMSMQRAGA